ncbi:conjugal transfer protein TrbA [Salmonella enterica]|uniref:conjugal transfer protein TrbA n=1 Tax=Salmonella enterica TaxID=28901 RepID=UPI0008FCB85D|nr:conjugal transfer protein TrbA [Salmonella enterica]EAN3269952.1 conjugal transfer protein TrbA [Salmonella enterica subsp. enterica serovar Oranienburg]EAP4147009.1 conjugal transfer protein TrbA [Salmonella enterica subsp. enterica serovar Anatum]EBO8547616.1 conjugal transfer protein TrbA [Salmonella enterica subsp. enterica serovar Senftenberg]EEJ8659451.1 conjugal transfer protein TrbA [Salmonella enterica subsp. enterica]EIR0329506.1 conjugal transfer protein TrbA [Salmonella enterica
MSEDCLNMVTGIVSLIFIIIVGYFFSERNDRKIFLLSSLVFLVINIACLYVLTARFWFLCGAIMNQGAAQVVSIVAAALPDVTRLDRFRRIFVCIMLSSVWSGVMWFFIKVLITG